MGGEESKDNLVGKMIHCEKQDLKKKSKDELVDDLYDSLVEIDKLKRELRKYKNPNTPPSAHPFLKSVVQHQRGLKRGAPKGHQGLTRPWKIACEERHIVGNECPNCQSRNISVIGQKRQQQEEIPPDILPVITDSVRNVCKCNDCDLKFLARDGMTPIQGRFGINLMVLVIFLKFIMRGVLRKTTSFLDASFALKLAPASVQAIIERAAKAGENEYAQLKQKIKTTRLLYIDETSFRVLGKNWWVWAFRSDTDLLLVIRNSRGNKVLEEILGKDYSGVVVCDCWRAYDFLTNASIQRCWAHLLRKSEELESVSGRHFHKKLSLLFEQIIMFNSKERTTQARQHKYAQMTAKLKKISAYHSRYDDCEAVAKYLNFHIESWFTCIKNAGVQPTNNYAEQAIRETVLVRKIIGAFRSEKGTKTYETLASLISTWKIQKLDIKKELHKMLTENLC